MDRNIIVYENDLKFNNLLKTDKTIIYDKPHLKDIGLTNTFEYRLKLMDSNNNFLDLSNMNLLNLDNLMKHTSL